MKISVIIPAFNAAHDLAVTLSHLFKSDYSDFEVIVVDDCSTDDTAAIARSFPVQVITSAKNSGAATARNKGSQIARGDILYFIDADVWVDVDTLHLVRATFDDEPQAGAVVGAYKSVQPLDNFYSHFQNFFTYYNHDCCSEAQLSYISWFWTACGAIKKEVFKSMGGFREIYVGASAEDMDLGYRLKARGYLIVLNKNLAVTHAHRHTMNSIVRNNLKKAAAWGELYGRHNLGGQYKHGFTSYHNFLTLLLVAVLSLSLPGLFVTAWSGVPCLAAIFLILLINRQFYALMYHHKDFIFLVKSILFHILASFFIGVGGLIAISRLIRGQEGEKF
ncbi:glycosyltransferase [candidate division CSSED10-310 bacterium]|uniref:Glycosyltransferase n=1 Tax=candidate division CSSED10-310 bacterium TaxID=2855610 RepID=A0ABV6YWJ0_UNCC1